jgi:nucleotide-binding universal stress UspA family protein
MPHRRYLRKRNALHCTKFLSLLSNFDCKVIELTQNQITRIVVPVDGSKTSMEAADYALKMAEVYDAYLLVVHVINIDQYLQSLGLYRLSYPESIKKKIEESKKEAEKWFSEITEKARTMNVRIKTSVIDTPLSTVGGIVNFAEQEGADLVVVGTRGRSGISKMLLGSVASGVVTYAACPVVVVK